MTSEGYQWPNIYGASFGFGLSSAILSVRAAGIFADVICDTLVLFFCIAAFVKGKTTHPISKSDYTKNFFAISVFFFLSFILMIMGLLSPHSPLFLKLFFPYLRFCKTATPCLGDGKYIYCDSILGNCEEFF